MTRESIWEMYVDLAGGSNGAQGEDARILRTLKVEDDRAVWGPYTTSRLQDLGYKTQDTCMQNIGNRSKCRTHE